MPLAPLPPPGARLLAHRPRIAERQVLGRTAARGTARGAGQGRPPPSLGTSRASSTHLGSARVGLLQRPARDRRRPGRRSREDGGEARRHPLPGSRPCRSGSSSSTRRLSSCGGATLSQVAINWCVAKGTTPIPGARNLRQLKANLGALSWRLDAASAAVQPFAKANPFPAKDVGSGLRMFDS